MWQDAQELTVCDSVPNSHFDPSSVLSLTRGFGSAFRYLCRSLLTPAHNTTTLYQEDFEIN